MQVTIPFGDTMIQAELPDDIRRLSNLPSKKLSPVTDLRQTVRDALDAPLESPRIGDLVKSSSQVTIAFDDATVGQFGPIRQIAIEEVVRDLEAAGVDRKNVNLICANALHRKQRPEELVLMLGEELVRDFGDRLFSHDAEDKDNLVYLGQTENGYDVEISRYVMESDLTVYVNASHNRGFAGGWKSICVGLSTYRSIRHHHHPDGMSMSIHKNRMHEVLDEMGAFLESKLPGSIFKIDSIPSSPMEIGRVFAGGVNECRSAALDVLKDLFPPRRTMSDEKFDVLIYGVSNVSPYSIFSSMNPILTLISSGLGYLGGTVEALGKPGCSVIMVTPCPNQWDHICHAPYPHAWDHVLPHSRDPYEIEREYSDYYLNHEELLEKYRNAFAFHPVHALLATHPLRRLKHIGQVYVASIEDPATAEHIGFQPTATVEAALNTAREHHGNDAAIAYIEQPVVPTKLAM